MMPSQLRQVLLFLSNLVFFIAVSVSAADTAITEREKLLDKEILGLYKDLTRARELLAYEKIQMLPNNTSVNFIGNYPNRSGIRIKKFFIETDSGNRSHLKHSEEKSILIEFNGSALSKIEISVISEDVLTQQKTKTILADTTPLDDNINDILISFSGGEGMTKFPLSEMRNDDTKAERNQFKKDFYVKFLLDFHSQISSILASQKDRGIKGQKNMLKQLNGSLNY